MSQAGIISEAVAPLPPAVPTQFTTDNGTAVPAANNLNVFGGANGGVNATTTGTGSTITLRSDILNYTNPGAYPYSAVATDYFISVNSGTGAHTILLPNAPPTGKSFVIKDRTGNAAVNNITVTTVGGAVNIDGSTSFTINSDFGAISLVFNGTSYEVF